MSFLQPVRHHWKEKITSLILAIGMWYLINQNLNNGKSNYLPLNFPQPLETPHLPQCPHCNAIYTSDSNR